MAKKAKMKPGALDAPLEDEIPKSDIHIKLAPDKEKEVVMAICEQVKIALQDRSDMEGRWEKWIDQYEERLPEKKNFPWENASNISVPLSAIAVETIHAREVNTLFSLPPYVQVRKKKKEVDADSCEKLQRFLHQVMVNVIDFYDIGSQWLLEKNKMGTAFLKVYWNYDRKKTGKDKFEEFDDVKVDVISIEDIIVPVNAVDIQTCSFLAHRIRPHWNALSAKQKMGVYKNVDKIKTSNVIDTSVPQTGKDVQKKKETVEKLQRTNPDILKEYQIYEVYFEYDIDGDGYAEPVVMTVHLETNTCLRFIYHPFHHGRRPFIRNVYQSRVKRVYGKGVLEQSEHLSDAVNTSFNQTIDNMTIANVKCFKGRKTARKDIGKIYPGKFFWLDDPTDIVEFSLGEVHQSNFLLHNMLKDYHERRTKVTDYTQGKESSAMKSRATATGTLALLQESGRHFDLIINNSRKAISELAYQIIELYNQYRPEKIFLVDGGTGDLEELVMPKMSRLREEYDFFCSATSLQVNKEIEKQSNLMLLQQLGQIFGQMIQLLSTVMAPQVQMPPELKEFMFGVIRSYYTMAQDLVRSFEKIDVASYLPELPDIVKEAYGQGTGVQDFMGMLGGMINGPGIGNPGGNPAMAGVGSQQGLESLLGGGEGTLAGKPLFPTG